MSERMTDELLAEIEPNVALHKCNSAEAKLLLRECRRARAAEVGLEEALNVATRELESLKQSKRDKGKLADRIRVIVREEVLNAALILRAMNGIREFKP